MDRDRKTRREKEGERERGGVGQVQRECGLGAVRESERRGRETETRRERRGKRASERKKGKGVEEVALLIELNNMCPS